MSEEEAENAWAQSKEQTRKDTEPTTADTDGEPQSLEDAVADAYEKLDDNDISSNLTLRDDRLAALFHGLENADRLGDVGQRAADTLERDEDDTESRAAVLRLLVRIGLNEVDDGEIQAAKDGRAQFLELDEF